MAEIILFQFTTLDQSYDYKVVIADYTAGKTPITYNDDGSVKITNSNGTKAIYNSAIYAGMAHNNRQILCALFAREGFTLKQTYKPHSSSSWYAYYDVGYFNTLNNGFYTVDRPEWDETYYYTFFQTANIDFDTVRSDLDIPIFTDLDEYQAYIATTPTGASVKVTYSIPESTYEYVKLVYKKDRIPTSITDGISMNLDTSATQITVSRLSTENGTKYYFVIFTDKSVSGEFVYTVGSVPPPSAVEFDKTGNIQTFTAPKTGRYKIETWGAQGGNAVSGNVSARGGYGSYSTCEIELAKGQTIYVNVGGQDGYNCGGEISITNPTLTNLSVSGNAIAVGYQLSDAFGSGTMVAKKGSTPQSVSDGIAKIVPSGTKNCVFTGLDPQSAYYFVLFAEDKQSSAATATTDVEFPTELTLYKDGIAYHPEYFDPEIYRASAGSGVNYSVNNLDDGVEVSWYTDTRVYQNTSVDSFQFYFSEFRDGVAYPQFPKNSGYLIYNGYCLVKGELTVNMDASGGSISTKECWLYPYLFEGGTSSSTPISTKSLASHFKDGAYYHDGYIYDSEGTSPYPIHQTGDTYAMFSGYITSQLGYKCKIRNNSMVSGAYPHLGIKFKLTELTLKKT